LRAGVRVDPRFSVCVAWNRTLRCGDVADVASGHTARQIADRLVISEKTVDRHRTSILEKLHLKDRLDLARYAIRRGLVDA
jgi:DNA-binding NarL/FixJ family response regulator